LEPHRSCIRAAGAKKQQQKSITRGWCGQNNKKANTRAHVCVPLTPSVQVLCVLKKMKQVLACATATSSAAAIAAATSRIAPFSPFLFFSDGF
jgi:hypothetical protein